MFEMNIYINGDVINTGNSVNKNFFDALFFMYERWPHLINIFIFNTEKQEVIKELYPALNFSVIEKANIPKDLNKLQHLIDNNYDSLYNWEFRGGKAVGFNDTIKAKEIWDGLNMRKTMTKEEFIKEFRREMHLYE